MSAVLTSEQEKAVQELQKILGLDKKRARQLYEQTVQLKIDQEGQAAFNKRNPKGEQVNG